ncbi:MAG: ATP-binding protein [Paludibacteraceae bacterium]|nr:ATP-binding protein [Paludibacteraceae bacterium]
MEKGKRTTVTKAKSGKKNNGLNMIVALDAILEKAKDSKLSDKFWKSIKTETDYLKGQLEGFSEFQLVVLAVLIDAGMPMSWKTLGDFFGCSRLTMMTYTEEVDDLMLKRWVKPDESRERSGYYVGYKLERGVVTAIRHNMPFVPECLEGFTVQQVVDRTDKFINSEFDTRNPEKNYLYERVNLIVDSNMHLPLCKAMDDMGLDEIGKTIFMMVVCDYSRYADSDSEGLEIDDLEDYLPEDYTSDSILHDLRAGNFPFFKENLVEHGCDDGIINTDKLVLTEKAKTELLAEYNLNTKRITIDNSDKDLKKCNDIKPKELFYNPNEEKQVGQLAKLLQPERFEEVQSRLEERGLRKGFACLFYGGPGTGKTETVLQIARETGRDVMMVEIAGMKDKWVGESEKNIKAVFRRYKRLCKDSEKTPILFFNESDALINKRNENAESSADKMNNAMQSILLQELEDLDGILIATTNLTDTLDKAFERRFLYKIEFKQPNAEVKSKIWQSKIAGLADETANKLAKTYDLSGGQIENIARKSTIDYVLYGKDSDIDQLEEYCRSEELSGKNKHSVVGFL